MLTEINFSHIVAGINAKKEFEKLQEEDRIEFGTNPYNGTISTCKSLKVIKTFQNYSAETVEEATSIMNNYLIDEGIAYCIDLGRLQDSEMHDFLFFGHALCQY